MSKWTPCDDGKCPYLASENQSTGMYFCRDMCGLGVDEDEDYYDNDYEDRDLEMGYDPYCGCYTDDC